MSRWVAAVVAGALVFTLAEVACRAVLHLSDQVVPLVALPLTVVAVLVTALALRRRI